MIGQDASTPATEYGPQWMNIPNLASRCQASWSAIVPSAKHERARTARATAAILARNILLLCGMFSPSKKRTASDPLPTFYHKRLLVIEFGFCCQIGEVSLYVF